LDCYAKILLFYQNVTFSAKFAREIIFKFGPVDRPILSKSYLSIRSRPFQPPKTIYICFLVSFFQPRFFSKKWKKNKILFWGVNIFDRLEVTGWPNVYPIASLGNKERLIDFAHQNMTHMTKILTKKFYYDNFSFEYKKNTRFCPGLLKQKSNFFFQFFLD